MHRKIPWFKSVVMFLCSPWWSSAVTPTSDCKQFQVPSLSNTVYPFSLLAAGKQSSWCQTNGFHGPALLAADNLLTKLQAGMKAARVPVLSLPPGTDRRQAILRALCAGYATQTAVPFSTDAVKAGYLVTSEYVTNPAIVLQHPASSVPGPGGPLLLLQSRTVTSDGREMLLGMSRVEQGWVEEALAFDAATRAEFVRTMQVIARKCYEVPVSGCLPLDALILAEPLLPSKVPFLVGMALRSLLLQVDGTGSLNISRDVFRIRLGVDCLSRTSCRFYGCPSVYKRLIS
jgi:hypothetical protein